MSDHAPLDAAPAPTEDRWDYDTHPGDCHPRREPDGTWTVCCRECAGTGVWPFPWINSPAEGRADMDRCSDVLCKGTGRAVIGFAAAPTDRRELALTCGCVGGPHGGFTCEACR